MPGHRMHSPLISRLDTQATWRVQLERHVAGVARFLADHELANPDDAAQIEALRRRLRADRLTLAFVAEFSRGKSELINAIFFADTGRRVLPATPGRTTMCPVELFHDPEEPATLSLLPIETRLEGLSLAELRGRVEAWQRTPLDPGQPETLVQSLAAVTVTTRVPVAMAQQLGFWHPEPSADNPPQDAEGKVEIPAWRHALINYPHPLLRRGLIVIDTPGLNAIGAEPELTLSLLPTAHATVFVLAADAGVTKSDLSVWREHLGGAALERFVVLNKIDALADPLLPEAQVQAQIDRQCRHTADTLGLDPSRVFPLSAREALAARVAGDEAALRRSRLPDLEAALASALLPRQTELLAVSVVQTLRQMHETAGRRLGDRRRQNTEQLLELRGLRGKSGATVALMLERLATESTEFEHCTSRLRAVRAVQDQQQQDTLAILSGERLRAEVSEMRSAAAGAQFFAMGARKSFEGMFQRLGAALDAAQAKTGEMQQMLDASFRQLNAEFGFAFTVDSPPDLKRYHAELDLIAQNYGRYIGFSQAWRLAVPGFIEQFRRMLLSKLRLVFQQASSTIAAWGQAAVAQIEHQLRERRKGFQRRRWSLERIQSVAGDLDAHIGQVEAHDTHLCMLQDHLDRLTEETVAFASAVPATADPA